MSHIPGRRERRAYDSTLYVNRQQEIDLVKDKCTAGTGNDTIPRPVICFWGGRGIGKSWLLGKLELELIGRKSLGPTGETVCARLDLDPYVVGQALWRVGGLDRAELLHEVWRQLAAQAGEEVPTTDRVTESHWADGLVNYAVRLIEHDLTPVILLDSVDELVMGDPAAYEWLEEHVLERLAITDRVVLVLASRGKPNYVQRWQMRRRVEDTEKTHLRAFKEEDARVQARKLTPEVDSLFAYSHGYPLATDFLAEDVHAEGDRMSDGIAAKSLRSAVKNILEGVEPERAEIARLISVLRRVDIEPMRAVLVATKHPLAEGNERVIDDMILTLRNDHLLYWDSDRKTYAFDAALRRVLADLLRLADGERFQQGNAAAAEFYRRRIQSDQTYLPWDFCELLFACCLASETEQAREPAVRGALAEAQGFLGRRPVPAADQRAETLGALERDGELLALLPKGIGEEMRDLFAVRETM